MWIIDRFEGNKAVIEDGENFFDVPAGSLPKSAKEGDVLRVIVDEEETQNRKKNARSLMDKLFKKSE